MRKVTGVLAFIALLLVAAVPEVSAVPFNSANGVGACSSTVVVCAGANAVAITPNPLWTPNGGGAVWVSYAQTGSGPGDIVAPNTTVASGIPTATYTFSIATGFQSLSLLLWADDTLGVRLDGGTLLAPNPTQGPTCAAGGVTCTGAGTPLLIPLGGLAHTLQLDAFQIAGDSHGLMYQGELALVQLTPEPASLLLVGSALAAVGFVSRRRMQKNQTPA